jgi:sn-glycerol 3-phosphate transport system substrate-binding protein
MTSVSSTSTTLTSMTRNSAWRVIVSCLMVAGCSGSAGNSQATTSAIKATTGSTSSLDAAPTSETLAAGTQGVASTALATTSSPAVVPTRCRKATGAHEIKVWHSFGGNNANDEFDALVSEFNQSHVSKISAKKIGGYEDLLRALAATPVDQWPDIIAAPQAATRQLLDSGHFLVPDACEDTAGLAGDLLPIVSATYSVDGRLVSMPYGVSTLVLFFDKAEFRKAGLDPAQPPSSLAELMAASATLKSSGATPFGLVVSDHFADWVTLQGSAKAGRLVGQPENGRTSVSLAAMQLNNPTNIAELALFRDAITAGHAKWISGLKSDFDDLLAIVADKDGGSMSIHTSGSVGDVLTLLAAGNFPGTELGIAPMPGVGPGSLVGGNSLWHIDHGDPERSGATAEVIAWLTAPHQLAAMSAATGYVPATRSAAVDPITASRWQAQPELRVAYDTLAATPVSPASAGLLIGPSVELDYALYRASNRIATTTDSIEIVLSEVDSLLNELLKDYQSRR